jgi:hypothetical protein
MQNLRGKNITGGGITRSCEALADAADRLIRRGRKSALRFFTFVTVFFEGKILCSLYGGALLRHLLRHLP